MKNIIYVGTYVLVRSHKDKTYLRRYKRLLKAGIKVSLVNCGQFPCSWIRIRIRISSSDPDPQHWINATGRKCVVLPCFFRSCLFSNVCQFSCVPGMYVLDLDWRTTDRSLKLSV
jgi:hypothetical protein